MWVRGTPTRWLSVVQKVKSWHIWIQCEVSRRGIKRSPWGFCRFLGFDCIYTHTHTYTHCLHSQRLIVMYTQYVLKTNTSAIKRTLIKRYPAGLHTEIWETTYVHWEKTLWDDKEEQSDNGSNKATNTKWPNWSRPLALFKSTKRRHLLSFFCNQSEFINDNKALVDSVWEVSKLQPVQCLSGHGCGYLCKPAFKKKKKKNHTVIINITLKLQKTRLQMFPVSYFP